MRNKKLISMLMLSAGFVACSDEIVESNYAGDKNQEGLIEDVLFNVSLNENAITRGQYAGGADKVFTNFYLEPDYTEEGEFDLSNNSQLKGDMIGLCLASGSQAQTNYPFYIAGYGSLMSEVENAKDTVYVLSDQEDGNSLYKLGLTEGQTAMMATKALIKESVDSMAKYAGKTPLAATKLDTRMGIVRTNTGIMSGKYVAYYPYDDSFAEVGAIPAVELSAMIKLESEPSAKSVKEAIDEAMFYEKLFAVSSGLADVTGKTKVGSNLSLQPLTGLISFNIKNTGETECEKSIKRITVTATENSEDTDFILAGTVSLDARGTINATEGKTSSMIGVSFDPIAVPVTGRGDSLFISIPCYPNLNGKKVTVDVYTTDGMVARYNKTAVPALGTSVVYTIDLKDAEFEATLRKVFNTEDFLAEVVSGGEIELMDDINVYAINNHNFEMSESAADLVVKGDKTLNLCNGTISKNITMEKGTLILNGVSVSGKVTANTVMVVEGDITGDIEANRIDIKATQTLTQLLKADELNIDAAGKEVILKYASVGTLKNGAGTLTLQQDYVWNEYDHYVTATTVDNWDVLNVNYLSATTVRNRSTLNIANNFNVGTVNNESKFNTAGTAEIGATISVTGYVNSTCVFNNNHWGAKIDWNYSSMDATVNVDKGTLNLNGAGAEQNSLKIYGKVVNKSTTNVGKFTALSGANSLIQNTGTMNINANISVQNGQLAVEGGHVYLAAGASLGGNSAYVTVADGANVVKTADSTEFVGAVVGGTKFEEKYTKVRVSSVVSVNEAFTTEKTIELNNGTLTVAEGTALADVVAVGQCKLTAPFATAKSITIAGGTSKLTIENSYINVEGSVTNGGTYDGTTSTVNCATFSGYNWVNEVTPNC